MKLLVVEDNPSLVENIFEYFEARGHVLDAAPDGVVGLHLARTRKFDAIILDWMLPRLNGPAVLAGLRQAGKLTPIIMMTAKDELNSKIEGFRAGADDYLTKPFELPELEVRLEALVRRSTRETDAVSKLSAFDLELDLRTLDAHRGGEMIHLYPAGRKILEVLMRASPAVVEKATLEEAIWGDSPPDADLLRSHIYELRKAVDCSHAVTLIQTVPRIGYRLVEGAKS